MASTIPQLGAQPPLTPDSFQSLATEGHLESQQQNPTRSVVPKSGDPLTAMPLQLASHCGEDILTCETSGP